MTYSGQTERERLEARAEARAELSRLLELRSWVDEQIALCRDQLEQTRRGVKPRCGTEKGYQWHRHNEPDNWPLPADDPCECRAAHAVHVRARSRAAQEVATAC